MGLPSFLITMQNKKIEHREEIRKSDLLQNAKHSSFSLLPPGDNKYLAQRKRGKENTNMNLLSLFLLRATINKFLIWYQ